MRSIVILFSLFLGCVASAASTILPSEIYEIIFSHASSFDDIEGFILAQQSNIPFQLSLATVERFARNNDYKSVEKVLSLSALSDHNKVRLANGETIDFYSVLEVGDFPNLMKILVPSFPRSINGSLVHLKDILPFALKRAVSLQRVQSFKVLVLETNKGRLIPAPVFDGIFKNALSHAVQNNALKILQTVTELEGCKWNFKELLLQSARYGRFEIFQFILAHIDIDELLMQQALINVFHGVWFVPFTDSGRIAVNDGHQGILNFIMFWVQQVKGDSSSFLRSTISTVCQDQQNRKLSLAALTLLGDDLDFSRSTPGCLARSLVDSDFRPDVVRTILSSPNLAYQLKHSLLSLDGEPLFPQVKRNSINGMNLLLYHFKSEISSIKSLFNPYMETFCSLSLICHESETLFAELYRENYQKLSVESINNRIAGLSSFCDRVLLDTDNGILNDHGKERIMKRFLISQDIEGLKGMLANNYNSLEQKSVIEKFCLKTPVSFGSKLVLEFDVSTHVLEGVLIANLEKDNMDFVSSLLLSEEITEDILSKAAATTVSLRTIFDANRCKRYMDLILLHEKVSARVLHQAIIKAYAYQWYSFLPDLFQYPLIFDAVALGLKLDSAQEARDFLAKYDLSVEKDVRRIAANLFVRQI